MARNWKRALGALILGALVTMTGATALAAEGTATGTQSVPTQEHKGLREGKGGPKMGGKFGGNREKKVRPGKDAARRAQMEAILAKYPDLKAAHDALRTEGEALHTTLKAIRQTVRSLNDQAKATATREAVKAATEPLRELKPQTREALTALKQAIDAGDTAAEAAAVKSLIELAAQKLPVIQTVNAKVAAILAELK